MLAGGLLPALALTALSSVLPKIDVALAHDPHDSFLVKQLVGVAGLAMVIGAPSAGFLVNRIGSRQLLVVALFAYVIAGTAGLYVSDLKILLASRFCVGGAAAVIQILSMTLINVNLSEPERSKWMGRHVAIAMFGTILVHPIVGSIGELGWRWPFAIYAAGLLLLPAILQMNSVVPMQNKMDLSIAEKLSALRIWFPWRYLPMAMTLGGIAYLPIVYLPYLFRESGVSSSIIISLVLTADALAGVGVALLYGFARRYFSHRTIFIISLSCAACGALIATIGNNAAAIVIGLIVFGAGVGWFIPNLMNSLSTQVAPHHQSSTIGWVKAMHFLAAPVFIALAEPFARRYGPAGVMLAVTLLSCSVALMLMLGTLRMFFISSKLQRTR